jgi:tryptophan halogenase
MRIAGINPLQLVDRAGATIKNGIRFENWTNHTPVYYHSIRGQSNKNDIEFPVTYAGIIDRGRLLSDVTRIYGCEDGFVPAHNPFHSVNQFHFNTFHLNTYLREFATIQGIHFVEGKVQGIERDTETGNIKKVLVEGHTPITTDFVVDASGFNSIISSALEEPSWTSFSDYLLVDSAFAGPSEHGDSNVILPFTRAIAQKSGWMWEIPTQDRKGNGYVYSSAHSTEDEAAELLETTSGVNPNRMRRFKFDPGYRKEPWKFNCCAIGLSSSFVEPLEATSIATTINQSILLAQNLAVYDGDNTISKSYNKQFGLIMENILEMIRLHYISDRQDSDFWRDCSNAPIPDGLAEKLEQWKFRPPMPYDFESPLMLFRAEHFFHVAQGQGLLGRSWATTSVDRLNVRFQAENEVDSLMLNGVSEGRKLHAEAIREILEVANSETLWGDS